MRRLLIVLAIPALAGCASGPSGSGAGELSRWSRTVARPESEARIVEQGDPAIPALKQALLDPACPGDDLGPLARALGRIWSQSGSPTALEAYLEAVKLGSK